MKKVKKESDITQQEQMSVALKSVPPLICFALPLVFSGVKTSIRFAR